jgi:anthranilate synthase component I
MFRQVTLEEFKKASSHQKKAVVFQEFPCDDITPIHAFLALNAKEGAVLLESAVKDQDVGRYSLLAIEPFAEFKSKGTYSEFVSKNGNSVRESFPFEHLRNTIKASRLPSNPHYPPMVGGAIGFATYDAIRLFEEIPDRHPDQHRLPDLFFLFHTVHIAFDHLKGSIFISVIKELSGDLEKDYADALEKIREIRNLLKTPLKNSKTPSNLPSDFVEDISDDSFCEKVRRVQEHIRKGDAFQVVLSRTFSCPYPGKPFEIYRALRMANPSPFMFYIETGEFAIAGSSPERLVRVEKGKLHITPIAGTRPRNGEEDDEKLTEELMECPKEETEHMMLVDLGRNDLGIVAEIGTVQVKELKKARIFPHVIHLVSQIEARLAKEFDELDALKAVFPAGTLSGAPKIRAMEIIDQLEESRRGLYGGTICTIDNHGNLDSCIAIRTAFIKDGVVSVRAGAGIVFESDPEKETEETRAKAKGVIKAVHLAMAGII